MNKFISKLAKIIFTCLIIASCSNTLLSQVIVGVDYGNELKKLGDEYNSRSGTHISAGYFINQSVSLNITLGFFTKSLVDPTFDKIANWTSMSQSFSVHYYILISEFRPYVGLGIGHYSDKIDDDDLPNYFNENNINLAPELGFLANLSPKVKLNGGARYNYMFDNEGSITLFMGLKVPLVAN